jgi:hypothetical protein
MLIPVSVRLKRDFFWGQLLVEDQVDLTPQVD